MEPTTPFWFKQRQCRLEPAGDNQFKVSAPNFGEVFLRVEPGSDNRWRAALRRTADGPDEHATPAQFPSIGHAWQAAFELFRGYFIA
jgi:hypothetical protein